ncbi:hypothetical protein HG536_0C04510 [Torulaspora globosa]|uniref:Uncharacterized protein n=1 Tax=Torulaspora globosa TaxID=48254 RepID=A0A7G3ZFJ6_9SACH|nr:uncharacterized protein HG536_0C04510 [Torulaspora globosa]QLL32282.1 hypothetical protein HG536_0C04510 [Torulaspora globosa]
MGRIGNLLHLALISRVALSHKHSHGAESSHNHDAFSHVVQRIQDTFFPFSPRYNSVLATLAIQLAPCVVIFSIPGLKKSQKGGQHSAFLPILVSFAFGTLLGDIFLHLIPEIFETVSVAGGSHTSPSILGSAILAGFMLFLFVDKSLRVMSTGSGEEISLSSHSHSHIHEPAEAVSSGTAEVPHNASRLTRRKKASDHIATQQKKLVDDPATSRKPNVSAYLSIITGCVHNVTDGIALASSFYSSRHIGATTTIAVMFHEVPHEVGDFVILLSGGFTFAQAVKSQLITSVGALLGTAIGCFLNEWGNTAGWYTQSPLLLPISCGGFIYIATVAVAPQVLQSISASKTQEIKLWALQFVSIVSGFAVMAALRLIE